MPTIAIIGAGIVGLSTAVCIQRTVPEARVTVFADKFTADTTSDGSGGIFLPAGRTHFGDERRTREICRLSWQHYSTLEASEDSGIAGVARVSGYQLYFTANYGDPLPFLPLSCDVTFNSRSCSEEELRKAMPAHPCNGFFTTTLIIENRLYLPYLTKRFEQGGGLLVKRTLTSLTELFSDYNVIVNCSGLGSQLLCSDAALKPARGQVMRVRAPHVKHFTHIEQMDAPDSRPSLDRMLIYILPQSESVVLGGTYDVAVYSTTPDEETSKKIMDECSAIVPSLRVASKVKDWVGLRPARYPIRLERELAHHQGKMITVIHNYGHGSNGVALSWGSAEVACRLAKESLEAETAVAALTNSFIKSKL